MLEDTARRAASHRPIVMDRRTILRHSLVAATREGIPLATWAEFLRPESAP